MKAFLLTFFEESKLKNIFLSLKRKETKEIFWLSREFLG